MMTFSLVGSVRLHAQRILMGRSVQKNATAETMAIVTPGLVSRAE